MKTILISILVTLGFAVQAMPEAKPLFQKQVENIVSVPGYFPDTVNLAVAIEFSNPCVASVQDIMANQDDLKVFVYSTYTDVDAVCTAHYEPTIKWAVVAKELKVGDQVIFNNGQPVLVEAPAPAICIKSICSDGSQRDSYTCACANGFTN